LQFGAVHCPPLRWQDAGLNPRQLRVRQALQRTDGAETPATTFQPPSHVQPAGCTPGDLRLVQVFLSPMTGEHGSFYKLANHERRACTLEGYPRIRLYAHGVALPFRYSRGGRTYVTRAAPRLVTVRPGGAAWFLVAKYRCDLGTIATATSMTVTLPGARIGYRMPAPYSSSIDHCRGGPSDPGQQAALQRSMTDHALAFGFSRGFLVAAGIALLALVITVLAIRVRPEDLAGNPKAAPGRSGRVRKQGSTNTLRRSVRKAVPVT